jgi:hypothetical protein
LRAALLVELCPEFGLSQRPRLWQAPHIAPSLLRRPGYPHQASISLCRRERLLRHRPLVDVSNSFSQTLETEKRQNRSGKIIEGTPSKIMRDGSKPVNGIKGSRSPRMLPPQTKLIKASRMPSRIPSIVQISQKPPKFLRWRHGILRIPRPRQISRQQPGHVHERVRFAARRIPLHRPHRWSTGRPRQKIVGRTSRQPPIRPHTPQLQPTKPMLRQHDLPTLRLTGEAVLAGTASPVLKLETLAAKFANTGPHHIVSLNLTIRPNHSFGTVAPSSGRNIAGLASPD